MLNQLIEIRLEPRFPCLFGQVEPVANPVVVVEFGTFFEPFVFAPVIRHTAMGLIDPAPASGLVEPAWFTFSGS